MFYAIFSNVSVLFDMFQIFSPVNNLVLPKILAGIINLEYSFLGLVKTGKKSNPVKYDRSYFTELCSNLNQ